MGEDHMTIGQKIKEIRESKDMKQIELARLCNMDRQQLQAIEVSNGYPRIQTLMKIAKAMRCPLRDILNEPLKLGLDIPPAKSDTDYPCANAEKCMFFKKRE
jgi:transcriptional regulator with XRE-family HTH domain